MADDNDVPAETEKLVETTPRELPRDRDWLLADIVKFSNAGIGFDVIVWVNGQIIVGRTISTEAYFEEMAKRVETGIEAASNEDRETIEEIASYYRSFKDLATRPENAPDDFEMPPPMYIHLENAYIAGESRNTPTAGGFLWRGRLTEIAGFTMGTMSRSS